MLSIASCASAEDANVTNAKPLCFTSVGDNERVVSRCAKETHHLAATDLSVLVEFALL